MDALDHFHTRGLAATADLAQLRAQGLVIDEIDDRVGVLADVIR